MVLLLLLFTNNSHYKKKKGRRPLFACDRHVSHFWLRFTNHACLWRQQLLTAFGWPYTFSAPIKTSLSVTEWALQKQNPFTVRTVTVLAKPQLSAFTENAPGSGHVTWRAHCEKEETRRVSWLFQRPRPWPWPWLRPRPNSSAHEPQHRQNGAVLCSTGVPPFLFSCIFKFDEFLVYCLVVAKNKHRKIK